MINYPTKVDQSGILTLVGLQATVHGPRLVTIYECTPTPIHTQLHPMLVSGTTHHGSLGQSIYSLCNPVHLTVNDRTEGGVEEEPAFSCRAVSAHWEGGGRRKGKGMRHTEVQINTIQKLLHTYTVTPIHTKKNIFSNSLTGDCLPANINGEADLIHSIAPQSANVPGNDLHICGWKG